MFAFGSVWYPPSAGLCLSNRTSTDSGQRRKHWIARLPPSVRSPKRNLDPAIAPMVRRYPSRGRLAPYPDDVIVPWAENCRRSTSSFQIAVGTSAERRCESPVP